VQVCQAFFQLYRNLKRIGHTWWAFFRTLKNCTDKLECRGDRPCVYQDAFQLLYFILWLTRTVSRDLLLRWRFFSRALPILSPSKTGWQNSDKVVHSAALCPVIYQDSEVLPWSLVYSNSALLP
jgi:hypothetical protein